MLSPPNGSSWSRTSASASRTTSANVGSTAWCSTTPACSATALAWCHSSRSKPGKRAVNACRRWSPASRPESPTIADESTPPLSDVPTGTSARSRSRIASSSSSRSASTASS
jgi:hypothetical protein